MGRLKLVEVLRIDAEKAAQHVFGPLDAVQGLLWEHLEGTVRDLVVFFRVFLFAIRLCFVRNNHLDMAFGSQSATIKQRHPCIDAFLVNKEARLDIV